MLRCQSPCWCIPPALASSWPRTPAPTAETFQCFSGGCVYTTTECPDLPLCVSTLDRGGFSTESSQTARVILKKRETRAGKGFRESCEEILSSGEWMTLEIKSLHHPRSSRWRESGSLSLRLSLGRSSSTHLDTSILPLNIVRAHVNTMISLCLPLKWISAVDLQFKSM